VKRITLGINGTTLNVPVLASAIRVNAISIPGSGAATIELLLLDGAGATAFRTAGATALGVCFAVGVIGDGTGNIIGSIPQDFIVNDKETLQINASAAIVSDVILSFEDEPKR